VLSRIGVISASPAIRRSARPEIGKPQSSRAAGAPGSRRQLGPRFRRQVPMDPYVVDLYCSEAKLIVEVDGEFHSERQEEDARRTACLERRAIGS
jgi:Protein of unknown function (DUF559)